MGFIVALVTFLKGLSPNAVTLGIRASHTTLVGAQSSLSREQLPIAVTSCITGFFTDGGMEERKTDRQTDRLDNMSSIIVSFLRMSLLFYFFSYQLFFSTSCKLVVFSKLEMKVSSEMIATSEIPSPSEAREKDIPHCEVSAFLTLLNNTKVSSEV